MVRGPRIVRSAADRKMDKAIANGHSGFAGPSILEKLEEQFGEACVQYQVLKNERRQWSDEPRSGEFRRLTLQCYEAKGRVRGLAIAVATLRHPLRVGEQAWWRYINKLEMKKITASQTVEYRTQAREVAETSVS